MSGTSWLIRDEKRDCVNETEQAQNDKARQPIRISAPDQAFGKAHCRSFRFRRRSEFHQELLEARIFAQRIPERVEFQDRNIDSGW